LIAAMMAFAAVLAPDELLRQSSNGLTGNVCTPDFDSAQATH